MGGIVDSCSVCLDQTLDGIEAIINPKEEVKAEEAEASRGVNSKRDGKACRG